MTQTYRTDDGTRWGTGHGSNLTPAQVDINFWDIIQRLVLIEALPDAAAGIDHFTVSGTQFYVVMTDATTLGPYDLPVATFFHRGEWEVSTAYSVLDTFTINGGLYSVIFAHTSDPTTFDAGDNDGLGHEYYALMIQTPGSSLPTGGATGMVLEKSSGVDYATTWGWKTPTGGTARQYLIQQSATQDDAEWGTPQADDIQFVPATGSGISSTNVADALEELESEIQDVSVATVNLADLGDVLYATGDPALGAVLFFDGAEWVPTDAPASADDVLVWNGSAWVATTVPAAPFTDTLQYVIDGGGSTITTGMKGYIEVPFDCVITRATLLGDQSGSIVVNVYKTTYSAFDAGATHPLVGDKITASAPPTISAATKSQDSTLTGWTTSVAANNILAFNVDSVTSMQRVTLSLRVTR